MKTNAFALLVVLALACTVHPSNAQSSAFTYQGALMDNGAPANGLYDLRFAVFDAEAEGTRQGAAVLVHDLSVTNGLFTVTIKPKANVFTGAARWLDIAVRPGASTGDYTNLVPRQPITSTPYAMYALSAGNLSGAVLALPATTGSGEGVITIGGTPALQMTGADNAFVGGSGNLTMAGERNTANGVGALQWNESGNDNTAMGFGALEGNVTGSSNIAVGKSAGSLITGDNNIAIGHEGVARESGTIRIGTPGVHRRTSLAGDVQVSGAAVIGTTANGRPQAGTIRWTGSDFEGYNGSQWVSLTPPAPAPTVVPVTNMVYIQPGSFAMGSPASEEGRLGDEGPQTTVTISRGFWMGIYEVTQWEYTNVTGRPNPSAFQGLSLPVEQVSWIDATNYCALLTERERSAGRIPSGYVYRLPTEAEWEYVCRAGTSTRFSHGNDPGYSESGGYAWYSSNSGSTTHVVGGKGANPWGLYDMHGNVFEWCQDWYGGYPGGVVSDSTGPVTGSYRVIRGGGCHNGPALSRSAYRFWRLPTFWGDSFGFRVVLAPVQ